MVMHDTCDGCGKNGEVSYTYYPKSFLTKRNWSAEFLVKKGRKKADKQNFQFCQPCQEELREFRTKELIQELSQKNLATSDDFPKYYFSKGNFTAAGYQAVEKAIQENVIRHISEWRIVKLKPFRGGEYYHDWDGDHKNEEITMLVHQSAQVEYGSEGFFQEIPKKMYPQQYFSSAQWAKIEEKLTKKNQTAQPTKLGDKTRNLIIGGIVILIIVIISLLIYLAKSKKFKK